MAAPVGFMKALMRKTRIGASRIKMVFDQVEELGGSRQARCWRHGSNLDPGEADQRGHGPAATTLLRHRQA
ncbi:hypothetical protein [Bradyrhizobium sp. 35]|uniref:hypothetical protein n=1 Tax=Bradyrhizobium sp. 35 TaxID=2782670 RepID=UPI001FF8185D|nr:hypothetical protein [Bradyrhizobium sp. 35]